jgi:hypothetical protein
MDSSGLMSLRGIFDRKVSITPNELPNKAICRYVQIAPLPDTSFEGKPAVILNLLTAYGFMEGEQNSHPEGPRFVLKAVFGNGSVLLKDVALPLAETNL